jgi:hypothetical protein
MIGLSLARTPAMGTAAAAAGWRCGRMLSTATAVTPQQQQRVGVIGLGKIGLAMARNWLVAGESLIVHDVDPTAVARLADDNGVVAASSAAEVAAGASRLVTVLPNDSVLMQVCIRLCALLCARRGVSVIVPSSLSCAMIAYCRCAGGLRDRPAASAGLRACRVLHHIAAGCAGCAGSACGARLRVCVCAGLCPPRCTWYSRSN